MNYSIHFFHKIKDINKNREKNFPFTKVSSNFCYVIQNNSNL